MKTDITRDQYFLGAVKADHNHNKQPASPQLSRPKQYYIGTIIPYPYLFHRFTGIWIGMTYELQLEHAWMDAPKKKGHSEKKTHAENDKKTHPKSRCYHNNAHHNKLCSYCISTTQKTLLDVRTGKKIMLFDLVLW